MESQNGQQKHNAERDRAAANSLEWSCHWGGSLRVYMTRGSAKSETLLPRPIRDVVIFQANPSDNIIVSVDQ
jgi:hypothetical protein